MNDPQTSHEPTALEEAGKAALREAEVQRERLQPYYAALAQCEKSVPKPLQETVSREIDAMKRASEDLQEARQLTDDLRDELSARLFDTNKSVNRKWWRLNPPANGAIDLQEKERDHFARGINLYKIILILFIGSFAGVVVEVLWCLARHGYIESRAGLVYGPFNMLYGVGAAVLSIALYRFRNRGYWLSFLGGFAVGTVVEYACSWLQEMVFGSTSWDYSKLPLNLNGRVCLLYSLFWGVLGVLWIKDIYPRMSKWILKLPNRPGKIITWVVAVFLLVNCVVSSLACLRWSDRVHGIPARNAYEEMMDARFPDERMEKVYANMTFDNEE